MSENMDSKLSIGSRKQVLKLRGLSAEEISEMTYENLIYHNNSYCVLLEQQMP